MNIILFEMMISLNIRIVLKRVSVSSETIIADIRQLTLRKFLIINEQTTASQFFYLLMQSKRAFSIIHIKLEDLPGCANLTGSVGGHIECKVNSSFYDFKA